MTLKLITKDALRSIKFLLILTQNWKSIFLK